METPEQVIAKIRSAPDDASAMKILTESGYKLEAEEREEMSSKEMPDRGPGAKWDLLMAKHMGGKKEPAADAG